MKDYFKKNRLSSLIIIACLISMIILSLYHLNKRSEAKELIRTMKDQEINNVSIMIDKFANFNIEVDRKELINQFKDNIFNFEWEMSYQKMFEGDQYTVYDFNINGESDISSITLIGKSYVLVSCFDYENSDSKIINLKVTWNEDSYNRIIDFVNKSR